ncbi:MAG: FG-GAP repeat protein [Deltaproteobacteria bacterium]|nr:FG-GAP repeat protein [Deltaproteobacteria bacterium]
MKKFLILALLVPFFALSSCDDDENNNNNTNNTTNNTNNCACGVSIVSINGVPLEDVSLLTVGDDDQDAETAGFQIDVVVEVATEGYDCVPADGTQVTLTGGLQNAYAVLENHTATFTGYTIFSGAGILGMTAVVPDCQSETTEIRLSTAGIPECNIINGISQNAQYSCPDDDLVPNQLGLQRVVTVHCVDVASGTGVDFYVDGNLQTNEEVSVNGEVEAVITLPVTGICQSSVSVSISLDYNGETLSDYVNTGESCCLGEIPCSMEWVDGTEFVSGTPVGIDTLNRSTDNDWDTDDHQSVFHLSTDSGFVNEIAVLADDGSGTYSEICRNSSVSSDTPTLPCTIPDGTVALKPACYTDEGSFEDISQVHYVYVDTVPPLCAGDLECSVTNYHEVDIECSWSLPGTAGDEVLSDTDVRYTANYDEAGCLADSNGIFSGGWGTLDEAPGSYSLDGGGDPGDSKNYTFTPFVPSPGYCIGTKPVDMAGNTSDCTDTSWTGSVYPNYNTVEGITDYTQFGSAISSADMNCDGKKDLIVGAPNGYEDPACFGDAPGMPYGTGGFCNGDGLVYIFFAQETGGFNATPDVTITYDTPASLVNTSWAYFGLSVAGIGNFTRHSDSTDDSSTCEDIAIGALWDYQDDENTGNIPGAVYILKGRPSWTSSDFHTADGSANGMDAVIRYERSDSSYADFWSLGYAEELGHRVAPIGDFNGDSWGDLAISAPGAMPSGAVYVLGSRSIPFKNGTANPTKLYAPADMDMAVQGSADINNADTAQAQYENLGESLSALGDINGDGYDDFIIGAPGCNIYLGYQEGKVYIVSGGSFEDIDVVTYDGTRLGIISQDTVNVSGTECFGWAVAGLGDFNDDGMMDYAVSDNKYNLPESSNYREGAVFVFFGTGSIGNLTSNDSSMKLRSEWPLSTDDNFGRSIGTSVQTVNTPLGDFNADGIPDLLVGTQHFGSYHGSAFVWYGDGGFIPSSSWATYEEATFWFLPPNYGYWGYNVRWLGDIDGDGYSDLGVGDPGWDSFYGGPGDNPLKGRVTVIY